MNISIAQIHHMPQIGLKHRTFLFDAFHWFTLIAIVQYCNETSFFGKEFRYFSRKNCKTKTISYFSNMNYCLY